MARSNGGKQTQARLIKGGLIAAILCTVIIVLGLFQSAEYERQADNKRAEYAKCTGEKVAQTCIGIPPIERLRCVNDAFEAKRDYETNQYDLEAQRKSALWAYIMGAAAVIGMALSAVGVWLVKTTFDETRTANNIAIEVNRAWIGFSPIENGHLTIKKDSIDYRISVSLNNHGGRPAVNAQGWIMAYLNQSPNADLKRIAIETVKIGEGEGHVVTVFPNQKEELHLAAKQSLKGLMSAQIVFVIVVAYRDAATLVDRYTAEAFQFHTDDSSVRIETDQGIETLFHQQANVECVVRFRLHQFSNLPGIAT